MTIHNLNKHLGGGKATSSNEAIADGVAREVPVDTVDTSVKALATTKDLPENPEEGAVYHVNGVDWVFVKGEWVTRQGIYGHEDFGDAHEPLWDGTGEKPNIETQRAESEVVRENSDEPAITPEGTNESTEQVVSETEQVEEVVEENVTPEPIVNPASPSETMEEATSETEAESESVVEPTVHEQVEAHEAAANPIEEIEESETQEEEKPSTENVDGEPLAHPVEEDKPVEVMEPSDVGMCEETMLAHDRIGQVANSIDQLHTAQTALEAYHDVVKTGRVSKQSAAVLHKGLVHIDRTFNLKVKATGLEAFDTTPRSAMESVDIDGETITGRMKQIGGAVYKKIQELLAKLIEYIKNFDLKRKQSEAKVDKLLSQISDVPRNAIPENEKIKVSKAKFFYAGGKFVGTDTSAEVAVIDLAVSAAMAMQSNVVFLGQQLAKMEATSDGVNEFRNVIETRLSQNRDHVEKDLPGGGKIIREGHALILERGEDEHAGEELDALSRTDIEKALKSLQKFYQNAGKSDRISRIVDSARTKSQEAIKAARTGGDERYVQELQQLYVTAVADMIKEMNLQMVTALVTYTSSGKAMYLEACLENLKVQGAGMESHDPFVFSNEGLFTEIGHFFNAMIHGRKEDLKPEQYNAVKSKISKTFGDPNWLKNRRFIEGDIKFKGDPSLGDNFKQVIAKAVGQLNQAARGNAAVFTRAANSVKPYTDFLIKMEYRNHPEKTQKMYDGMPSFDKNKFKPVKYNSGMAHSYVDVTLPAMTPEQVASAADEIIKAIDYITGYWKTSMGKEWWDTFNVENEYGLFGRFIPAHMEGSGKYTDVIRNIATYTKGEDQKWCVKLASKIAEFADDGEATFFKEGGGQWEFYFTYIRGLINWMDASTR
ncbi:hypothetical protein RVBP21_3640 [Pseudomonas phage BRkr]|nr:hypothetical protein RVBP21_3640 [Pseudomonas phage BRkr]